MTRQALRHTFQAAGVIASLVLIGWTIAGVPPHTWDASWRLILATQAKTVVLLIAAQCAVYVVATWGNVWLYRACGARTRFGSILRIQLISTLANTFVPTAGASGIASWIWLASKAGIRPRTSAAFNAVGTVLGYVMIIPIIAVALLTARTSPVPIRVTVSWVAALATFGLCLFAIPAGLFLSNPGIHWLWEHIATWNIFRKTKVRRRLRRIVRFRFDVKRAFTERPESLLPALMSGFFTYTTHIGMLWAILRELHGPIRLSSIVLAYCLTNLVSFTSFLPSTLGVVELSLTVSLQKLGISAAEAVSTTLLYRLCTFWLPIPAGLVAWIIHVRRREHRH